jgi:predicted RNA binding protein YcfA (HicA-like mRNA interferase family)
VSLSELPRASGRDHVKALKAFGWSVRREGNHIILTNPDVRDVVLSIPNHSEVRVALLKSELRKAGIVDAEYRAVFDRVV